MVARDPIRPPTERLTFLIAQLGDVVTTDFTHRLVELDLQPRQFGMLRHLFSADGSTQQQLASALGIHRNVMVGLVDELEARGLVERRAHPGDRRAHALHLTVAARALLPDAARRADQTEEQLCAPLSVDERTELSELLTRMSDHAGLRPGVHPRLQRPVSGGD